MRKDLLEQMAVADNAFSIRYATVADALAIADVYNEAIARTTATFDTESKTEAERLQWLESHDDEHPVLVAEVDGCVVGWAALTKWSDRPAYGQTVESSFYVGEQFRGRGIGRALKLRLIEEARSQGHYTILARVAEGNAASIKLNESVGFQHIGTMKGVRHKFGQRLDVHMMQLMIEPISEPEEIAPKHDDADNERFTLVESFTDEQVEQLHGLIREQWWGGQRTYEDLRRMVANSPLLIGLVETNSTRLVGFCRVLTDFAFRATIYDVMVAKAWQGRGLGRQLMDALSQHPKLQQVSIIYLACDPKLFPFYERWGFSVYDARAQWMIKTQREE